MVFFCFPFSQHLVSATPSLNMQRGKGKEAKPRIAKGVGVSVRLKGSQAQNESQVDSLLFCTTRVVPRPKWPVCPFCSWRSSPENQRAIKDGNPPDECMLIVWSKLGFRPVAQRLSAMATTSVSPEQIDMNRHSGFPILVHFQSRAQKGDPFPSRMHLGQTNTLTFTISSSCFWNGSFQELCAASFSEENKTDADFHGEIQATQF